MSGRDNETVEEILREQRRLRDRILHLAGRAGAPEQWATAVRGTIQDLADLAAGAEHRPAREVPELADRMLADELTVMINDCVRAGDSRLLTTVLERLAGLRRSL